MQHKAFLVCALYLIRVAMLEGYSILFFFLFFLVLSNVLSCESSHVYM